MIEKFKNKKMIVSVNNKIYKIKILGIKDNILSGIIIKNGEEIYIPMNKIDYYSPTTVEDELYIHSCKNDNVPCKGFRLMSKGNKTNWPCKGVDKMECEKGCVGKYNDLPKKLRIDCMNGMRSEIPKIFESKITDEQKLETLEENKKYFDSLKK